MIVFEDEKSDISLEKDFTAVKATTNVGQITTPITYNTPLQLLRYWPATNHTKPLLLNNKCFLSIAYS